MMPRAVNLCYYLLLLIALSARASCFIQCRKQRQLTTWAEAKKQNHIVGGPRVMIDPEFSTKRRLALEEQLILLGICPRSMEDDSDLAVSAALKTLNSFVSPRASKMAHAQSESIGPAALRTAHQIAFLVRQKRAEQADYLRNTDRARGARESAGIELQPLVLVLDNIRSAYNVGSILRTSETAGVKEVVCCGFTPTPPHDKVSKTAFDAAETVPTRHFSSTMAAVVALRDEGYSVYAMETTSRSEIYTKVQFPRRTALVLGNEVTGVDTEIMDACDGIVEIPTYGMKNSLCVSSAAPVVIFEILRQWGATESPSTVILKK